MMMGQKILPLLPPATKTQGAKGAYKSGQEGFGFVFQVEAIFKHGNHCTGKSSKVITEMQLNIVFM